MTDSRLTLSDAQRLVDEWIHTYGVRYFSPLTNMAVLTEEVGEVARLMARQYGDQSFKKSDESSLTSWRTYSGCSSVSLIRRVSTSRLPSRRT